MFEGWIKEAGPDCTLEWIQHSDIAPLTDINPNTNRWWKTFVNVFDKLLVTNEICTVCC